VYSDLAPALGKKMLIKARDAYLRAEALLEGCGDEVEKAKLNFNFGNTLRQIDPNDVEQLREAEHRFLKAREVFAGQAPQFLEQIDTALSSVRSLLKIAPTAVALERNRAEMETLKQELVRGENLPEIIAKVRELMARDGGAAGMIGQVQALSGEFPSEAMQSERFTEIQKKINTAAGIALGGSSMGGQEAHILDLLRDRLESELSQSKITDDRAETLRGLLAQLGSILSGDEEDVNAIVEKMQKIRGAAETRFDTLHYLSHGLDRPPPSSRGAELVELCWSLRRFLLEEMNRSGKGPEESKEALDLNVRATRVDKRLYEVGADDARAVAVDQEELRPLSLAVRSFSARAYVMVAQPIWSPVRVPVDTEKLFYSGSARLKRRIEDICGHIGLSLLQAPKGESLAKARWKQLQQAMITVFDLGAKEGPELAAVSYELGIALTLGKPLVVVANAGQDLPFDVDVEPVILNDRKEDEEKLASAIDESLVWTYPSTHGKTSIATLDYVLSRYPRPQSDTYVDQTVKMLSDQRKDPDPVTVTRTLGKFVEFLDDGATMLMHPLWSPVYPKTDHPRLFHVMPFRPNWAEKVTASARHECENQGVEYVRGDEMEEPNVIRSIWEEIAQASHVLVDLTDFNANVALEMGIAHTLGRPSLLVGRKGTVEQLFPMIAKLRVHTYRDTRSIGRLVREFLE
jgi:hypothetical protein